MTTFAERHEPTANSSSASPQPHALGAAGRNGSAAGTRPDTAQGPGDPAPLLFTPAQAAAMLQVPESWLRRRAARRQVPCAFAGKHLRFSRADIEQIAADAARPAVPARPTGPAPGSYPRRPSRPRGPGRIDSRRPST